MNDQKITALRPLQKPVDPNNTCANCRHFVRHTPPQSVRWGQCKYPLPPLPRWMSYRDLNDVADYFSGCVTFADKTQSVPR